MLQNVWENNCQKCPLMQKWEASALDESEKGHCCVIQWQMQSKKQSHFIFSSVILFSHDLLMHSVAFPSFLHGKASQGKVDGISTPKRSITLQQRKKKDSPADVTKSPLGNEGGNLEKKGCLVVTKKQEETRYHQETARYQELKCIFWKFLSHNSHLYNIANNWCLVRLALKEVAVPTFICIGSLTRVNVPR